MQEDRVPRGTGLLRCWIEQYGSAAVVYARGELDLSSAPLLRRCLERAATNGRSIIVDLRRVTYLDGTGFRVLEEAYVRARAERRPFWIIPSRNVQRLVALLHLDDAMPLTASVEDALGRSPRSARNALPAPGGLAGNGAVSPPDAGSPDAVPRDRPRSENSSH